ncbi:MAG: S41 family peptidase [Lachnospiraceae bacterium]|nr:S41 family peptidase [Lachnospiraceae bacterium]
MDQNQYLDMDSYRTGNQTASFMKKKDNGAFWGGLVLGMMGTLLITGLLVLAFWNAGKAAMQKNGGGSDGSVGISSSEKKTKDQGFVTEEMITKINYIANLIHEGFFLDEVSDEDLENGIYEGLMNALNDPYSEYYTKAEFEEIMQSSSGIYYGIGAYVSIDNETNLPKISGVFKNSPAEEAGLRTDDLIYMVNGEQTYGKSLSDVVAKIRGEENTTVNITIVRDSEQLEKTVTRRRVENPTVNTEMYENGMGYLQITEFDDVTTTQFLEGMESLYQSGMQGLILDLRANPGGNLSTVVQIAQNLLPEGLVVYTEDKNGNRKDYKCKGDKEIQIPMVVLVDSNSASAAEILSGAIQDYKKGTLVGKKTYGKGIVQSIIPSEDGTAVKITVSGYFTPNGRNIHKIGIEPDIDCDFDGSLYYNVENPVDTQLEKAKEVLADLMKK